MYPGVEPDKTVQRANQHKPSSPGKDKPMKEIRDSQGLTLLEEHYSLFERMEKAPLDEQYSGGESPFVTFRLYVDTSEEHTLLETTGFIDWARANGAASWVIGLKSTEDGTTVLDNYCLFAVTGPVLNLINTFLSNHNQIV